MMKIVNCLLALKYSGPGFVLVEREDEPVDEEERHFTKNRRNSIDDSQEVPHVSDAELEVTYEEGDEEEEEEFDARPLAAPFSSYDYPSSSNGYFQHNGTAKFHSEVRNFFFTPRKVKLPQEGEITPRKMILR
jgi:hypothetical protein